MNRRDFLKRLTVGATAVVIAANIPISWVPTAVRRPMALEYLTRIYSNAAKGKVFTGIPTHIFVSHELFEQIEGEMQCLLRYTDSDVTAPHVQTLAFKASRLQAVDYLRDWDVAFAYPPVGESRNAGEPLFE